jgi:hypothetical protein
VNVSKLTPCGPKIDGITTGKVGFSGTMLVPLNNWKRGSNLPGPQLLNGALLVIAGDSAMIAPTFRLRLAQPSRRLPMPGATELSTVE